jgi:Zn-dependent protease with chaperone function
MDGYNAIYHLQGYESQKATVIFLKDKLSIGLTPARLSPRPTGSSGRDSGGDEHNKPKVVYWYYDKIIREDFRKQGKTVVRHEGYPAQSIEVDRREFADKLEDYFKRMDRSFFRKMFTPGTITLMRVAVIFFGLLAAVYFFLVPWLAVRLANKVPVSFEEKMGNGMFDALKTGMVIDPSKTAVINVFFRELHIPTKYNIRVTVIKDDVANAFAMPGGNIIVYDKLLNGMNSYEELAALLSHEFTHVNNKHTTKSLFRQLGSTVFLSVILGDVGAISSVIIGNADRLKGLSYGRGLEKESDLNGLQILSERKIDCNGFVKLFELLQKEVDAADVKEPAEWISSHPDLQKRIEYVKANELFNLRGVEKNETLQTLFLKLKTAE